MSKLSPDTLKSCSWHGSHPQPGDGKRWASSAEILIPLAAIVVLLLFRAFIMAGVVAGVSATVFLVRALSPAGRRLVDQALAWLGHWVGQIVAVILLAPAFYVVMTIVRVMNRLTGSDPLLLRSAEAPTYWVPSDLESRRARHVRSMFCTERLAGARMALLPVAAMVVFLLVAAEIGLRLYGFGTPILYVQDPDIGYYPGPSQRARHPGRVVTINNHSMRAPDLPAHKTPEHVRILLLGDSTLMGTWVSNGELYSSLVQDKLNAAAGSPVFEVLNMGVNAWGPFHELAYVKKFGTFEADVAVICGPIYNAYRPKYGLERLPFFPVTHRPRLALEQVFYDLLWRYREKCLGPPAFAVAGEPAQSQCHRGVEAYAELVGFLQQQGVEVLVQMLPAAAETLGVAEDKGKAEVLPELTQRLGQLGVKVECAGPIFKGVQPLSRIYHDGVHFDRLGHRLYADYFAGRLTENSARVRKGLGDGAGKLLKQLNVAHQGDNTQLKVGVNENQSKLGVNESQSKSAGNETRGKLGVNQVQAKLGGNETREKLGGNETRADPEGSAR